MGDDDYEVLPSHEMQEKYGLYAENRPEIHLDSEKVPAPLRHLIPLAEQFGISDDIMREDLLEKTSQKERKAMTRAVLQCGDALDEWLAGPEADGPAYSDEYIAFSNLRLAADD